MRKRNICQKLTVLSLSLFLELTYLGLVSPVLLANERIELFNGARKLGMGGLTVPVVNDETALWENPAGLGRLRREALTAVDLELQVQQTLPDLLLNISPLDVLSMQGALDYLLTNSEAIYRIGIQSFPAFVATNFGAGLLLKQDQTAWINEETRNVKMEYFQDIAAVTGYSFRFFDGILKLGVRGALLWHSEVSDEFPLTSNNLNFRDHASRGLLLSPAVGILVTLPFRYHTNIGATWRDFLKDSVTQLEIITGSKVSSQFLPHTLDVGASQQYILSKKWRLQVGAEYRDLLNFDQEDAPNNIHIGGEFNYGDRLFFRGGLHQGYWTAGLELARGKTQFQLATYGEEIGTISEPRVDRRWVMKWAVRL